jgi:iron complex transport system substrate-binding protein
LVAAEGGSLYDLDEGLLASLEPDLILTQEQCDVCAVNERTVRRAAASLPGTPHVESVNPTNLAEVHAMFRRVGDLLGARGAAEAIVARFEATAAEIARRRAEKPSPRVALLEWLDPPFAAGHWNPELIAIAGGSEGLGCPGAESRRLAWDEVRAAGAPRS